MNSISKDFKRRKRNQWIVAILMIPVFIVLIYPQVTGKTEVFGMDPDTITTWSLIPIILALVYSIYNWRCPSCKKYLGRRINHSSCPRCGISFEDGWTGERLNGRTREWLNDRTVLHSSNQEIGKSGYLVTWAPGYRATFLTKTVTITYFILSNL